MLVAPLYQPVVRLRLFLSLLVDPAAERQARIRDPADCSSVHSITMLKCKPLLQGLSVRSRELFDGDLDVREAAADAFFWNDALTGVKPLTFFPTSIIFRP